MLKAGASLTGATAGAGVGTIVAGPVGTIVGAGAGWAVQELVAVGAELAQRHLAPRAEMRIGAVFELAYGEISARLMAGERPCEALHEEVSPGRSPGEELAEAILRAAADTHEERKLRYMAHLFAAFVFDATLSNAHKNHFVIVADQLTYRQLVALAVYQELGSPYGIENVLVEGSVYREEEPELASLRADLLDLFRRGLVRVPKREQRVRKKIPGGPTGQRRGVTWQPARHEYEKQDLPWPAIPLEINPREMRLSQEGERLTQMMMLRAIPTADREQLVLGPLQAAR
jgi:hypothetical protein